MGLMTAMPKRLLLLTGTAAVLAAIVIGKWIAGWGLVTIHVKDAPIHRVIASIAHQGHVQVESSLDPARPITLDLDRVTPAAAVDLLAIRADGSWRAVVIAAPAKAAIDEAVASLRSGGSPEGWTACYYPAPFLTGTAADSAIDPRQLEWNPEGPELDFSKLVDEAAQKSGVMIMLPKEWAPAVPKLPGKDTAGKALHALISSVKGQEASFYYLTEQPRLFRGGPPETAGGSVRDPGMTGGDPRQTKPEWMEQRSLALIKKLPPQTRAAARKEHDEMKALFGGIRDLPEKERREKFRELMANPAFQEKMADNRLLRDSKMTAQQRINRAVSYVTAKTATKAVNKP